MTNINFRFRKGAGSNLDIIFGTVTLKPTLAHSRGTSMVLPAPSTWDIINGEVLATNVQPTPEPVEGVLEWGYEVTVKDRHGKSYSFLVGVPDSTTAVEFVSLPRYFETKPPLFGQGPKGDSGEAATISVGTVTSGTEASFTNVGTNTDAVFDIVLPKGDKGDSGEDGVGVPTGGSALQYIRKDASNSSTEWATLNKTAVGLSNVDNTSDSNKPVSTAQAKAISEATTIANNLKLPTDSATTYPEGISVTDVQTSDGWPKLKGSHTLYTRITTERPRNLNSAVQYATAYVTVNSGDNNSSEIMYRTSNSYGDWGNWQKIQDHETTKATVEALIKVGLSSTVNVDEIRHTVILDSYNGVSQAVPNGIATIFYAPYKLRITNLVLNFDRWNQSSDEVNYTTFTLRRYDPSIPAGNSIVIKHTSTEGVTARKPWLFDALYWSPTYSILEQGQTLSLGWANQGTSKVDMPMLVSFGVEPL